MHAVVEDLEALAREGDATGGDRLERARTWRYAAHAWLDLGRGGDIECLEHARADLDNAEALLVGIDDPVERMKLEAGYGHVLRHLARARVDPSLVWEARHRLAAALALARTVQPDAVPPLQAALANTDSVMPLAEEAEALGRRIDALNTETRVTHPERREPVGAPEAKQLFGIVKEDFDKNKSSMDAVTREGLEDFMARLGQHVEAYGAVQSYEDSIASRHKLSALLEEFQTRARRPSLKGPGPSPGSHGEKVLASLQELKMFVQAVATDSGVPMGIREAAMDLFPRVARLTTRLSEAGNDEHKLRRLEVNEVRSLAHEVRLLARQQHLTLARPVWAHRNLSPDVNRLFFSGPAQTHKSLDGAASALGLEVNHPAPTGADFAERRWQDLRTAGLAVFDLSGGDPQVYYELGIALTLGSPLLLFATEGTQPPFDVAQNVRFYSPFEDLRGILREELDAALYGLQVQGSRGSTLAATLKYAAQLAAAEDGNALLRVAFQSLSNAASDPVKFLAALTVFNRFLGPREHDLIFPRWPGAYPDPQALRCFIVMPFRTELDQAYQVVARVAQRAGVEPIRGDVAEGQQIIESIWNEICRATHVTVDLTRLNLNVCLELGIAHTLGRATLLIGREGAERSLHQALPGIAKWRCHTYPEDPTSKSEFIAVLTKFFAKGAARETPGDPTHGPVHYRETDT
jgi:hypothetical protein